MADEHSPNVNTHAQDSLPRLLATRRHLLVDYTTTEITYIYQLLF